MTVATINWLKEAPTQKGLPRFVSVFTPEGEQEVLGGPPLVAAPLEGIAAEASETKAAAADDDAAEKTSLITVEPAQHLVTHTGRCVCINGELMCSRPGEL